MKNHLWNQVGLVNVVYNMFVSHLMLLNISFWTIRGIGGFSKKTLQSHYFRVILMVANIVNYLSVQQRVNANCSNFALVPTLEETRWHI